MTNDSNRLATGSAQKARYDDVSATSQRTDIGGVPMDHASLDSACGALLGMATKSVAVAVRLVNAYSVSLSSQDENYGRVLRSPGINFADGAPVVAAMKVKNRTDRSIGRVRGPSLFAMVLDRGREFDVEHYFVGTTDATLRALEEVCTRRYPGIHIAGRYAPPFAPIDDAYVDDVVAKVGTGRNRIVWLALGTPKQDILSESIYAACKCPCVAVGAAFDFEAGTVREAPQIFQRVGMEWLFRLVSEPRRLWRRYLFGNVAFLRTLIRNW
jgi:N-acetylglucosaminyldiphosphoundecaprenol N-acetyl-beta-D-mannosaminyltransferase